MDAPGDSAHAQSGRVFGQDRPRRAVEVARDLRAQGGILPEV